MEKEIDLNKLVEKLDKELAEGSITEAEWFEQRKKATAEVYTSQETPWAMCGHSGTAETWDYSRTKPLLEVLNKSGTFIDIGCSIGYINECLYAWTKDSPIDIEYFGVDICPELIEIAKKRMPQFADNYFVGNVDTWSPPQKFDYVRTLEISFVPIYKQKDFLRNLFDNYLADGGRLIIGSYTEIKEVDAIQKHIESLGFTPSGHLKKSYKSAERKMLWFDKD